MLLVDNKRREDVDKKLADNIQAELDKIKKETEEVMFYDPRTYNKQNIRKLSDGRPEKSPPVCIPLIDLTEVNGDSVTFTLVNGIPRKEDGEYIVRERRFYIHGYKSFNPQHDSEAIYYLRHVSSKVRNGALVEKDQKKENEEKIQKELGDSEIRALILGKDSPLSFQVTGSTERMELMARSWNTPGVGKVDYDQMRINLLTTVQASEKNKLETKRGYEEFIKEVNKVASGNTEESLMRSSLQRSIERELIKNDSEGNRWMFGAIELMRYRISEEPVKFERLVAFCENNPERYKDIEFELYGSKEEADGTITISFETEVKGEVNYMKLKSMCGKAGLSQDGKVVDLQNRLIENYNKSK